MRYFVIIPASGTGSRFGGKTPKQFIKFEGKEVIAHTLNKFNSLNEIHSIIIATQKKYFGKIHKIISENKFGKVVALVEGGKMRQDSVYNALRLINFKKDDFIIVHDAVRPFVSKKLIRNLILNSKKFNAVIPGLKINDTVKNLNKDNFVKETVPRENIWRIQTPQVFRYDVLMNSYKKAIAGNYYGTDESSLAEYGGYKVKVIDGEVNNIKITTKNDINPTDKITLLNN